MRSRKPSYIYLVFITLLIFVGLELVSYAILYPRGEQSTPFYQKSSKIPVWQEETIAYNYIDPLLGWAIYPAEVASRGFVQKDNTLYLSYIEPLHDSLLTIYISGGSTSDLSYQAESWPTFLREALYEREISAEIYIAAVGGYDSGQELLKTIRDIHSINPDIHIAYNGANEVGEKVMYPLMKEVFFKPTWRMLK